jgi:hypothetical protein
VELCSGTARKATIYRKTCVNMAPVVNVVLARSGAFISAILNRRSLHQLLNRRFLECGERLQSAAAARPAPRPKPAARADALWDALGEDTIKVMADWAICLAQLWDSAWKEGAGANTIHDLGVIDESALETLYQNPQFLPSKTLDQIGPILKGGPAPAPTTTKPKRRAQPPRPTRR